MKWEKLGLIFCSNNNFNWMLTHAANPTVEHCGADVFRVYFSCRDKDNCSSIGFVEFDINQPHIISTLSSHPILTPGEVGTFDDSGASMGTIVSYDDKRYLYYLGWNLGVTVPWRNAIGLAIGEKNSDNFERYSKAPIVDRNIVDPFSLSYPWVLHHKEKWQMWYGSNLKWGSEQEDMCHLLKYAESQDGINWEREGVIAINFKSPNEYAMSKPCVLFDEGLYKMWFSYRGEKYRIGYAESRDGIQWIRKDEEIGIDVSSSGWDSEMIEYPCIFDHHGKRYMLYNGNGYGKTGFGLAVLEQD